MHQFFVPAGQIQDESVFITGSDVHHITHVLRLKEKDMIRVVDGKGNAYLCMPVSFAKEKVTAKILKKEAVKAELFSPVTLFQGMPKRDKMEWIIQKAVELGAYAIIPMQTQRCEVRFKKEQAQKKEARYQAIAASAAKQASRGIIPEVSLPVSFETALSAGEKLDHLLLAYELEGDLRKTRETLSCIAPGESVGVLIGPEGGFSKEEAALAISRGAKSISLGRRILRTETAPLAVLSVLGYLLETL